MRARHRQQIAKPPVLGDVGEQRIDVGRADAREHQAPVVGVQRQIAHQAIVFRYSA